MATVDKAFADRIIKFDGYADEDQSNDFGDNPRCVLIIEYDNAWGGKGYGLVFEHERNKYMPSEFVMNPREYWNWNKSQA